MKQFNRETGRIGEDIATQMLLDNGHLILKRNFSNKFGEIDIITKDNGVLVFVEVKTKIGVDFGLPEEQISGRKLARIRHMAEIYTHGERLPCRIDVVAIVLAEDHSVIRMTHYKNVY